MGWLVAAVYSKEDAVWAWSLGFPILAICGLIARQSAKWPVDKPARLETGCGRSSEKAETTADIVRAQLGPPMEIEENGASITRDRHSLPDVRYGRGGIRPGRPGKLKCTPASR